MKAVRDANERAVGFDVPFFLALLCDNICS